MKRPTIADIARQAGVSKVAVSYALNDQPGVSASTRARIKAIAQEVGWRPSSAARALNGAQARAVGLAVCRPARTLSVEPFFMELIGGIESELAPRSIALMLQTVTSHDDEIELYRRWWGEGRVDGALLVDLHDDDARVPALAALDMPVVALGPPHASGSVPAVWSDDGASIRDPVA
ncbi:MAG: LacI family transcriptional regulator [Streptomyces sp.]|jgi:DNA-binding LacI/PurR family transcriptional regulator|nr:LacI family transcriptional regulator [Streptomyces sp.]